MERKLDMAAGSSYLPRDGIELQTQIVLFQTFIVIDYSEHVEGSGSSKSLYAMLHELISGLPRFHVQ